MPWVRIDDTAPTHPKMLKAGAQACWLWVAGLCYSQRHKTDGFLPVDSLSTLVPLRYPSQAARALVDAGMWEEVEGGWRIHDYGVYQQSKETIDKKLARTSEVRSQAGRRGAEARWKKDDGKDGKPQCDLPSPHIAPTPPNPTLPKEQEEKSADDVTTTTAPTKRKGNGHPRSHLFCGKRICVPQFMHDQFDRQLGSGGADFDLLDWYQQLDKRDDEPVADLFTFLREEFKAAVTAQFGAPGRQHRPMAHVARSTVFDTCLHEPPCLSSHACRIKRTLEEAKRDALQGPTESKRVPA